MEKNAEMDLFWRKALSPEMGGVEFDKPGGGYSFSSVLAEERALIAENIPGDRRSALLCLSIADPTWKMPTGAFLAGAEYFRLNPYSTRYTDNFGVNICPEAEINNNTHEQLAAYLWKMHPAGKVSFTTDWVQYSPGSIKRALAEYIPTALFGPDSCLFFPTPGYGVIKDPKNKRGVKVVDVPMVLQNGQWDIDYIKITELLSEDLRKARNRVLYLNMPHNPTGAAYDRERWSKIIRWANTNRVILIVDEAYTHLRFGASCSVLDVEGWETCCVVLQSVSKGWNATGLRFGWVVANPTFIKAIRMVMDVKDSGMFGPSIASGLWCLKNTDYTKTTVDQYSNLHVALAAGLQEAGFGSSMPQAGLCQFTPAPVAADGVMFNSAVECAQWFRKVPRISLMHYTLNDKPWLRWAVTLKPVPDCGLPDELSVIDEAARRLRDVKFVF